MKSGPVRLQYMSLGKGSGEVVLLLHGLQGRAALWEPVAGALAARGYHPYGLDLRGHGRSDRAGDYGLAAYAGDVIALLERLGPMPVVGHSLGGRIAWEVAAARPDLVQRLIIEDQHPNANPAGIAYWEDWAAGWPARFADREEGIAYLQAQGLRRQWWEPSLVALPDGGWGWAFDIPGVVATARSLATGDGWASLARVQAPTLLIRGGTSEHLTADVAARMMAARPRGRLVTVAGIGHWVSREAGPYADLVAGFLGEG